MRFSLSSTWSGGTTEVSHRELFENLAELTLTGRGRRFRHRLDR